MRKYLPQSAIFILGFVSAATEMLTLRQLTPITGSTPFITSMVLAFSLLGLACGLCLARKLQQHLIAATVILSILIGIGLSYPIMYLIFHYFERILNTPTSLLFFSSLIVFPIFTGFGLLLGIGNILLFILGAACGVLLSTIWFMGWFGLAWTIIICSALLLSTVLLSNQKKFRWQMTIAPAITFAFITVFNLTSNDPNNIATNAYADYRRIDNVIPVGKSAQNGKALIINNSSSSFVEYKSLKGYPYIEMIKKIIFTDLKLRNKDILVLGAGGFTLTASGAYQNNITYVDIDPKLEQIVQENYLSNTNGKFVGADARSFLRTNQQKFDVIISDVFAEKINTPTHLATKEYYQLIERNLTSNGLAIFNTIISPRMQDEFSQQTDNTIRSAFHNCMVIPHQYVNNVSNVIYACKKNTNADSKVVYSDHQRHKLSDIVSVNSGMSLR